MKKIEQMIEVMQAYCDGADIEYKQHMSSYWCVATTPTWDWDNIDFRIKDRYAELKAAAADPTKQIRLKNSVWIDAGPNWNWKYPAEDYEIRDKPKDKKQIKLLAWYDGMDMFWRQEGYTNGSYQRVPSEDKVIEIEE